MLMSFFFGPCSDVITEWPIFLLIHHSHRMAMLDGIVLRSGLCATEEHQGLTDSATLLLASSSHFFFSFLQITSLFSMSQSHWKVETERTLEANWFKVLMFKLRK